jgi:hypothetical protein
MIKYHKTQIIPFGQWDGIGLDWVEGDELKILMYIQYDILPMKSIRRRPSQKRSRPGTVKL